MNTRKVWRCPITRLTELQQAYLTALSGKTIPRMATGVRKSLVCRDLITHRDELTEAGHEALRRMTKRKRGR